MCVLCFIFLSLGFNPSARQFLVNYNSLKEVPVRVLAECFHARKDTLTAIKEGKVGHVCGTTPRALRCTHRHLTKGVFCRNSIFKNESCFNSHYSYVSCTNLMQCSSLERAITALSKEQSLICFGQKMKQ